MYETDDLQSIIAQTYGLTTPNASPIETRV